MKKRLILPATLLLVVATSAMANSGLDKAKALNIKYANEEIQVIEDLKICVRKIANGAEMRACHLARGAAVKALRAARTNK